MQLVTVVDPTADVDDGGQRSQRLLLNMYILAAQEQLLIVCDPGGDVLCSGQTVTKPDTRR